MRAAENAVYIVHIEYSISLGPSYTPRMLYYCICNTRNKRKQKLRIHKDKAKKIIIGTYIGAYSEYAARKFGSVCKIIIKWIL